MLLVAVFGLALSASQATNEPVSIEDVSPQSILVELEKSMSSGHNRSKNELLAHIKAEIKRDKLVVKPEVVMTKI
jgi:hypothetical protein